MERTAGPSFQDVTSFLKTNTAALTEDKALFQQSLAAFIRCNENPSTSPNFKSKVPDLPGPLLQLLEHAAAKTDQTLVLLLLKVLKILSRRRDNRVQIGKQGIQTVFKHLSSIASKPTAAEAANIILNVCYERASVALVVQCGGVATLVSCLHDSSADLQANAAGAIQSICFQEQGRRAVGEADAVAPLISLLDSAHAKVRSRAVGALHNLSSDSTSIRTIRRSGGILKLVALLRSSDCAICGSAAGALQNVSREVASRMIIREMDTVCPLADLLSSSDLQAQVCAAGALLNILGPELERSKLGVVQRQGFGKVMSSLLTLSIVHEALFENMLSAEVA
ncbi:TPA: hypothetical protein ACH3X3_008004 [Trebouxia sp. C0006]